MHRHLQAEEFWRRHGHDLQEALRYHETWIGAEDSWVATIYSEVRHDLAAILAPACYAAWNSPPITKAADMTLGGWGPKGPTSTSNASRPRSPSASGGDGSSGSPAGTRGRRRLLPAPRSSLGRGFPRAVGPARNGPVTEIRQVPTVTGCLFGSAS